MSKAEITETFGGVTATWPDGVNINVTHLILHNSNGHVTGEIMVRNGQAVLYPQTYINFSADRTRNSLAKSLTERYPDFDWQEKIDQLTYHAHRVAKKDEPILELWTNEKLKPPEYVVEPIIMKDQVNVLFGPPESGKTQFAMILSLVAMLPWRDNNLGLKAPENCTKILWLDYEADKSTTLYNFTRIVHGAGVGDVGLNYRRCRRPLCDDIEDIAVHASMTKSDMIVIDSTAKAAGGDLDKSESPNRFFEALDKLNRTSLILAHTPKLKEGQRKIYGSIFFEAYARSVWELRSSINGNEMTIGIWDSKANYRKRHEPLAFKLSYQPEKIILTCENIETVDEFISSQSIPNRIEKVLANGSKTAEAIKELMPDVKEKTFDDTLSRMVRGGKLVKLGSGKGVEYGLALGTLL